MLLAVPACASLCKATGCELGLRAMPKTIPLKFDKVQFKKKEGGWVWWVEGGGGQWESD